MFNKVIELRLNSESDLPGQFEVNLEKSYKSLTDTCLFECRMFKEWNLFKCTWIYFIAINFYAYWFLLEASL